MKDAGVPLCLTSIHWSGYATTDYRYDDVKGSWVEPAVNCSPGQNADSVFWVGLDGLPSGPVEQIGTDAACSSGTPSYQAWYELYPAASVKLSNMDYPVYPGDALTGEVSTNFDGNFTFTLQDTTQGWTYNATNVTSTAGSAAGGYTAEWIAEAPEDFCGSSGCLAPLANFGTVNFTGCTVNGVLISQVFGTNMEIFMQSGSTQKAQPSVIGSDGQSFSVTWYNS